MALTEIGGRRGRAVRGAATIIAIGVLGAGCTAGGPASGGRSAGSGASGPAAASQPSATPYRGPLPPPTVYAIGAHSITPISVATRSAGTPIELGQLRLGAGETGPDSNVAVVTTPQGVMVYALLVGKTQVQTIEVAANARGAPITVSGTDYRSPTYVQDGLVASPDGQTVYVSLVSNLVGYPPEILPIYTATDTPGAPIKVPADIGTIAISPDGAMAYALTDDAVVPVNLQTRVAGKPIPVGPAADQLGLITVSPDGATVYVGGVTSDTAAVDVAAGKVRWRAPVTSLAQLVTSPDGRTLYACGFDQAGGGSEGGLFAIDTATGETGQPVVPGDLSSMVPSPDRATLYYLDNTSSYLTAVDMRTRAVTPLSTSVRGTSMVVTADGKTLFIGDSADSQVIPFDLASRKPGDPVHVADFEAGSLLLTP